MDVQREGVAEAKRRKRIIYSVVGVVALGLITLGLSRLEPAAPSVDRATVWLDSVQRGEMLRQVRGPGTLVPEEIRQTELGVQPMSGIAQVLRDECLQPQAFIQLAHQNEAGVRGDARSLERDFQKAIERELKRLVL